jgi:hypothetical protein
MTRPSYRSPTDGNAVPHHLRRKLQVRLSTEQDYLGTTTYIGMVTRSVAGAQIRLTYVSYRMRRIYQVGGRGADPETTTFRVRESGTVPESRCASAGLAVQSPDCGLGYPTGIRVKRLITLSMDLGPRSG